MKKRPSILLVAFVAVCFFGSALASREAAWRAVDQAMSQGLPRTAIENLELIIEAATAEGAHAEAIKAIGRKIALETQVEGGHAEEAIRRLEAELEPAAPEMKPVLQTILAHWYWNYFQQNRWRFMQRTQAGEAAGPDLQTWDLARILSEIDRRFAAALQNEDSLKAIPIADYDELLVKGEASDTYRPTLFDFLAYEALIFYQAGEQGAVQPEGSFDLDASGPIFKAPEAFTAWEPDGINESSPALKAVRLYQKLLDFHRADTDRSAYLDADLARLVFGYNTAFGEDKDERYRAALERFAASAEEHEIYARAMATLAGLLQSGNELVAARDMALRGLEAFPDSVGAALCHNIIAAIEAKSARISAEGVWNDPWPTLDVTYRNVAKVYFRAVPLDYFQNLRAMRWGHLQDGYAELLQRSPSLEWEAELPSTEDFQDRIERVPAPDSLEPGYYAIFARHTPEWSDTSDPLSVVTVWISDLALITEQGHAGSRSGIVLEAKSGEPLADATVRSWSQDRNGVFREGRSARTDAEGRFEFPESREYRQAMLHVEHQGRRIGTQQPISLHGSGGRREATAQTVFFTDRALYRPGQSVHFKGIALRADQDRRSYETLPRERVSVVFRDPNGQEIARSDHQTNDYGSFSGVFTAPRDRLMGNMSLAVESGPHGYANVSVEEYKRPKFQVEMKPPAESPMLAEPVVVRGLATAYTGTPIGGAKVSWRVERSINMPFWCWWWQPPAVKAIAHGSAITEADGTFEIDFVAVPDLTAPRELEPVFAYSIYADVTDISGETRSAERQLQVGYTSLQAQLELESWQTVDKPVAVTVTTLTLDGDPQSSEGSITVNKLVQPERPQRARLQQHVPFWRGPRLEPESDPLNPDTWDFAETVTEVAFSTDDGGKSNVELSLPVGIYRVSLATKDRFGQDVTARRTVEVIDPQSESYATPVPFFFAAPQWSVEPGDEFVAVWGTGYESGRAYIELMSDGELLQRYWTEPGRTQQRIELPITEELRGGVSLNLVYVRENRIYTHQQVIDVPWSNKNMTVAWESFRSKLEPGAKELWTALISGPDAERAVAEMVVGLYDASLDQYVRHDWMRRFGVFRTESGWRSLSMQNTARDFWNVRGQWPNNYKSAHWSYRSFPPEMLVQHRHRPYPAPMAARGRGGEEAFALSPFEVQAESSGYQARASLAGTRIEMLADSSASFDAADAKREGSEPSSPPPPDLSTVSARQNLNETAFFFPHLVSDDEGVVRIQFTMPEALTEWRFLGFAHDQELRSGFLEGKTVTSKDLMVEPNPPRFLREGDEIEFSVKITNQSDVAQSGRASLNFSDAATLHSVDEALGNVSKEIDFEVPAKESRNYSWRLSVPDGMGFLTYRAVAASARHSDGEEGYLPVLSRRILVTESMPLPIRGAGTKDFTFDKLMESGGSDTLRSQSYTVQMVSQPAWYAVLALPYLMEFPYECSEQVFNRLYANHLARHIANSDPKIRRIFDLWRGTEALDSPLEKNEDLKSVLLEETPWLRQAKNESEARRNVGLLFDANRLEEETDRALRKLSEQQLDNGLWPWFSGGRPSEYISLYIATGFGRLRHLGADIDVAPAVRSLEALDEWMARQYREIGDKEDYVLSSLDALYLYGRSFFPEKPIAAPHREAVDFYLERARLRWLEVAERQSQAHLALALHREGDSQVPAAIMASLKERSVSNEELGMFWRDAERSWWWYRAPIETQALMIEAFAEVAEDADAVEACKVWLLKQKQTQDWKTTKATADAVYGLLLRGDSLLSSDALVEVALSGEVVRPENVEAGTGFYEKRFSGPEVTPAMGQISVTKTDSGVSWGSAHWQYLEDIAKITPHEETPLTLKKTLFVKENTERGPALRPVEGPLAVGDELVVRIELRSDRDMEYLHLKDQRGSGTEPVNVLSRYRYQDGLGYYESTRDTASHFFIDYLPKGVYVFEYSTRIQHRGTYQSGMAEIQCMYAPEFNSHSESFELVVE